MPPGGERTMTLFSRSVAVAFLWAGPVSAQYLEETIFPALENAGWTVTHDGARTQTGGTRWDNLVLSSMRDDVAVRFAWVRETPRDGGHDIAVSPEAWIGAARGTDPADLIALTLTDAIWRVEAGAPGERHALVVRSVAAVAADPAVPDLNAILTDLAIAAEWSGDTDVVLVSDATLGALTLQVSDGDDGGEQVTLSANALSMRQEVELPADMLAAMDEEFGGDPETFERLFRPRIASIVALGDAALSVSFRDGDGTEAKFSMSLDDLTGSLGLDGRRDLRIDADLRADALSGEIAGAEGTGRLALDGTSLELGFGLPRDAIVAYFDLADGGAAGDPNPEQLALVDIRYLSRNRRAEIEGDFADGDERVAFRATMGQSREEVALRDGRIRFDTDSRDISARFRASAFGPDEVALDLGETRLALAMPFVPEGPDMSAPLEFRLVMRDYAVGEALWSMFDPGKTIPRDAVTLILDIAATGRLSEPMDADEPLKGLELDSVTLRELTMQAGGAEILGSGSALVDLDGSVPRGDGQFEFSLKGLIGLSGAVAQLGIVPPEALLGLRGALGAFARPVGEDHFVSEIEVRPDGSITANGLPLPIE